MGLFGKSDPDKPKSAADPRSSSTRNETVSVAAPTLIGAETVITGELNTSEAVQIEGRVEGKIKSSGLVVIGEAGRVKAQIERRPESRSPAPARFLEIFVLRALSSPKEPSFAEPVR